MTSYPFSETQKRAVLDLLVAGMYSDHYLASAEDSRIQRFLDSCDFASEHARLHFADESFTRVRQRCADAPSCRTFVAELVDAFPGRPERQAAYGAIADLMQSDGNITDEEEEFLSLVRGIFQL